MQKAFLRTSENCEELFRRLDSGISHIESSITEQRQVVETQSALIDKNSTYLDNKLGEYGKLISLEVEAMVARSGTLETNIQAQIKNLHEATEQVTQALSALGNGISDKRKLLETESLQMVNNINMTISNLAEEIKHVSESYEKTQKQMLDYSQKYKEANIDKFMKTSAEIIQEMETLAIDVNSIFNKSGKEDELWKKYYDGDHAVFTRFLANNMSKKEILTLREDYEKKADFRLIVDKYLDDFNSLIAVARENERASTLLALISGSNIGKIYYILARALGKVN
ncbi:MAG: hypothetical protein MJ212_02655 [Alphaproteobacteria bacterium]|nr:hypothetical protein [Alphaproteobacteria bacterium]